MSTEIIEKSAFYQEALAKGVQRGLEQGKSEGKAEGLHDAVLVTLRGRFGELPPDMLAHVGTETLDQVRARMGL